jgi:hypothetical protein
VLAIRPTLPQHGKPKPSDSIPLRRLHDILRRLPSHPNKDIWQLTPRGSKETFAPKSSLSESGFRAESCQVTGISRREYGPRLSKLLKKPYDKADSKIYQMLVGRQGQAVRNALKLERSWLENGGCNPEKANPSTSVHRLVARLNEFLESSSTEAS